MKQNLLISPCDLAQLKRQKTTGNYSYTPAVYNGRTIALTVFMAENEIPADTLEMALAEKADGDELPLFYIRHNPGFTSFQVTPGNFRAGLYLSKTAKTLSRDGLSGLFTYCSKTSF